jgi:hypothetical protein
MPTAPEGPGPGARVNDYDGFAEAYTADNETSLWNAYYTRPAVIKGT